MARTLRVGMIGTGYLATRRYIPGYHKLSNAEIVAVADPALDRAHAFVDAYGRGQIDVYASYREMLERDDIDAVNIVTPPRFHAEPAIAAARAGKHVMVEKPFAMNVTEADAMIAAAKEAGVKLMTGIQPRFSPKWIKIKELIDAGVIGDVLTATEVNFGLHLGYRKWFFDPDIAGGGVLMDTGIYIAAAMLYWFGPVESVFARTRTARREREAEGQHTSGIETEDLASISLEFKSGAYGTINYSAASTVRGNALYIDGTEGRIESVQPSSRDEGNIRIATTRVNDPDFLFVPRAADPGDSVQGAKRFVPPELLWHEISIPEVVHQEQQNRKVAAFVEACLSGTTPPVTGEDGRDSLEIVQAAYQSAERGRPVTLPLPR